MTVRVDRENGDAVSCDGCGASGRIRYLVHGDAGSGGLTEGALFCRRCLMKLRAAVAAALRVNRVEA